MCRYNITLNDELLSETRRSFASDAAMDVWLQQQVEALLVAYLSEYYEVLHREKFHFSEERIQSGA